MNKFVNQRKRLAVFRLIAISALIVFGWAGSVWAADLKLSPTSGQYKVGGIITVVVQLSSTDQAANAVSGVLTFPADKLKVNSLSKTSSLINLWAQEPSFSNENGQIKFEGVILNPGYTGSAGRVIAIDFKVKAVGEATVKFNAGDVLANDGSGTSIVKKLGQASFKLVAAEPTPEPKKPTPVAPVAGLPEITSPTHPDQTKWYSLSYPEFRWSLPADVTDVSFVFTGQPLDEPPSTSLGLLSAYISRDSAPDGISYFHLKFKNKKGWGTTAHYKVQIDTIAPENFVVNELKNKDVAGRGRFSFSATDRTSGLDHFEFQIDGSAAQVVTLGGSAIYETPDLALGEHTLKSYAIDKAGNKTTQETVFQVTKVVAQFSFLEWLVSPAVILVILLILIILIIILMILTWLNLRRLRQINKGIRQDVSRADSALRAAYRVVRDDIAEQANKIKETRPSRQLTLDEENLINVLRTDLAESEKYVRKEINNIAGDLN